MGHSSGFSGVSLDPRFPARVVSEEVTTEVTTGLRVEAFHSPAIESEDTGPMNDKCTKWFVVMLAAGAAAEDWPRVVDPLHHLPTIEHALNELSTGVSRATLSPAPLSLQEQTTR